MKKLIALLLAGIVGATLLVGCTTKGSSPSDEKSQEVTSNGEAKTTFVMGLDDSFPPMGFRDKNNEIVGFDVDVAKLVAEKLGMTLELKPINWDSKEMEINSDKIDVIWNGFSIDPERQAAFTLSKPYLANNQIIITAKDSAITKKTDLKGKVVGLQKGSTAAKALNSDEVSKEVKEVKEYDDNVAALLDLKAGRIEAVVIDEVVGKYYISQNDPDTYKILEDTLIKEEYAIGFKKGNDDLKNKVENAIKELVAEGKIKPVAEKWFGEDIFLNEQYK